MPIAPGRTRPGSRVASRTTRFYRKQARRRGSVKFSMSVGVDALLLVALCGMTSWLLQRRRRAAQGSQPASGDDDGLHALQPNAVLCQPAQPGQPARDWLITQVLQPSRGAPVARLCRLDGEGAEPQGLLLIPSAAAQQGEGARQVWLLLPLPAAQRPLAVDTEPPHQLAHAGHAYIQHADWRGLLLPQPSLGADAHQEARLVLYRSHTAARLLWWRQGDADLWYAGRELGWSDFDLLPALAARS